MDDVSKISPEETFEALPLVRADVIVAAIVHLHMAEAEATDATDAVVVRIVSAVNRGALLSVKLRLDTNDPGRLHRVREAAVRSTLRRYLFVSVRHERNAVYRRSEREIVDEWLLLQAVDPKGSPEEIVLTEEDDREREQLLSRLRRAIDELSEPYAQIFGLLLHEHLSLVEVARRLGSHPNSIYKQYQRGAQRIRSLIEGDHASGESATIET